MFARVAGWILLPANQGFISHYFRENQTISICSQSSYSGLTVEPQKDSSLGSPVCRRCHKAYAISKLPPIVKRKKQRKSNWGGL